MVRAQSQEHLVEQLLAEQAEGHSWDAVSAEHQVPLAAVLGQPAEGSEPYQDDAGGGRVGSKGLAALAVRGWAPVEWARPLSDANFAGPCMRVCVCGNAPCSIQEDVSQGEPRRVSVHQACCILPWWW